MHTSRTPVAPSVARSWLLFPARDTHELSATAHASSADILVVDIEDGLGSSEEKAAGRRIVAEFAPSPHRQKWVRVNDVHSDEWDRDMAALALDDTLAGIVLAKAESADDIRRTAGRLPSVPIVALIESVRGIQKASAIAAEPATVRLAFGIGDYRRDTGVGRSATALSYPRARLGIASRIAGIAPPVDGPMMSLHRHELEEDIDSSIEMGMNAKLTVFDAQTEAINTRFTPTADELQWAEAMVDKLGPDGRHITHGGDRPALARALQIQDRARSLGLRSVASR